MQKPHIPVSAELANLSRQFLQQPCAENEDLLIDQLNTELQIHGYKKIKDLFVEMQCVEHNVIHILAYEGQQWIEINPTTGEVRCL